MGDSWVIVGAGSAGCVLANRLSADPTRRVTLLDAGPPLVPGHVPAGIDGPSFFAAMQEPGRIYDDLLATRAPGIEPSVYQRGRGVGGSSAVNAMVALPGDNDLYRSWGWTDIDQAWSKVAIPAEAAPRSELGAVDVALLADSRATQLNLTRVDGKRVTAAQAYVWPALGRTNLRVQADARVSHVRFDGRRAVGVVLDDASTIDADHVVVCAGAIHSPVVLLRSGVDTPGVGVGLQDHPSVVFTLALQAQVPHDGATLPLGSALHERIGDDLIQLLPMSNLGPAPETAGLGALMAALMTPRGRSGSVGIDEQGDPVIDFALLDDPRDVRGLVKAAEFALEVLATSPFTSIVEQVYIDDVGTPASALGDDISLETWVKSNCADYVHATSTCAMGSVLDDDFAVIGYQNLFVCDASVFPTIPDANTHLPTTMVAERFALRHC